MRKPARKDLNIALRVSVPIDMTPRQATREVRTPVTNQCNWSADRDDVRVRRCQPLSNRKRNR
jgi:ribosomal protein S17